MLQARIKGGLGNQLYIYAATRAIAIRSGVHFSLDTISGFTYDQKYKRDYKLHYFNLNREQYIDYIKRPKYSCRFIRFFVKKINLILPDSLKFYIEQRKTGYDPVLHKLKPWQTKYGYIDGLWQSRLYFSDQEKMIRKELTFTDDIKNIY